MPITIDLAGKTALVTGASQGIGAEVARRLHAAGATVILNHPNVGSTYRDAEAIARRMNAERPGSADILATDVSHAPHVEAMMQHVGNTCGGLDFLVNNAAILRDRSVAKMSLEEWREVMQVNLDGVFHCCKYAIEVMPDGGAIVNMSSISAILGFYGQANYAAAKAGVASLTKVLARENGKRNIRVNAIAPGVVETAMTATIPENVREEMLKNVPLARMGTPAEIADGVLFLCSPLASYINGQILEINGGWRG